jgi:hypothetical protein
LFRLRKIKKPEYKNIALRSLNLQRAVSHKAYGR